MTEVHASIYTMTLLLTGGLSLWGLYFMATGRPVDGAFRATYILMVGVAVVQGLLGVFMLTDEGRPAQTWHYLYGVSLIVFMAAGYIFATRGDQRREAIIFTAMSAFAFGLILRAAETAYTA